MVIHHRPTTSFCCLWIHRGTVQDLSALYLLGRISLFLGRTNPCLLSPGPRKIQFVVHKAGPKRLQASNLARSQQPFRKNGAFPCQEQWPVSTAWVKQSTARDLRQEWIQAGLCALWTGGAASCRAHVALWARGKERVTPCLVSQCEQWEKEGRKMTWPRAVVYYRWLKGDGDVRLSFCLTRALMAWRARQEPHMVVRGREQSRGNNKPKYFWEHSRNGCQKTNILINKLCSQEASHEGNTRIPAFTSSFYLLHF